MDGINYYLVDSFIYLLNSWGFDIKYVIKFDIGLVGMKYFKVSYLFVWLGGLYGEKLFLRFLVGLEIIFCWEVGKVFFYNVVIFCWILWYVFC